MRAKRGAAISEWVSLLVFPFFMYPSYDALIKPLMMNPDPSNVAPENLHTSMPRDKPFIYGEFKAQSTAKIMPGNVKIAS